MSSRPLSRSTYIYHVRPIVLDEFCRIMDTCESPIGWRDLAKHLISDMTEMRLLVLKGERGKSYTAELIWTWGQRNHTVGELLDVLELIGNKRALNLFLLEIEKSTVSPSSSLVAAESLPPPAAATPDAGAAPHRPVSSPVSRARAQPPLCPSQPSDSEPKELNVPNVPNVLDRAGLPLPGLPPGGSCFPLSSSSDNLQPSSSDSSNSSGCSSNIASDVRDGSPRPLTENKYSNLNSNVESSCMPPLQCASSQPSSSDNNAAVLDLQQIFSQQVIAEGTHNFSIDRKLGEGAFGIVYKADIHRTPFAVKVLKKQGGIEWETVLESLHAEMKHLYMLRHPNVLELAGFCLEQDHCCLVYHFMPNGSLEDRLHHGKGDGPLLWRTRLEIAEGAARGLQYLHTAQKDPVIHGDIKSANILLDSHCQAKLGDFGIARMGPFLGVRSYTFVRSAEMRGTLAYLPDEYVRSRILSTKVDSYSFGVVLLELLTGMRAVQEQPKPRFLKDEVEEALDEEGADADTVSERLLDRAAGPCPDGQPAEVLRLACRCIDKRSKRPEMIEVLGCLEAIRQAGAETRLLAQPTDAVPSLCSQREPETPRQVPVESTDVHQQPLPQELRSRSPVPSPAGSGRRRGRAEEATASSVSSDSGSGSSSEKLLRTPCESDDMSSGAGMGAGTGTGGGGGGGGGASIDGLSPALESVRVTSGAWPDAKPRGVTRSFEAGRMFAARVLEGDKRGLLCNRGLPSSAGHGERAGAGRSVARPGRSEAASLAYEGPTNSWPRRPDGPVSLPQQSLSASSASPSSAAASASASQGGEALPEPPELWLNPARLRMEERFNQYHEGRITSAELFSDTEGTNRVSTEDLESRTGNR